ncbi:AhpD-like protein [Neohortaea acidophila]|uniref:AhpD-like protein n=1 Tax=Neohortaea acidophila TaxID=245834 RepID=A0A6A6PIE2_9PEZI|nr:AhpD-like protein [Neohortaea acidophila]KAF2479474.1 AhpD-like protein [Neohortaea acidophila]
MADRDYKSDRDSKQSTFVTEYSEEEVKKAHDVLYNEGLRMRIKVNGESYVRKALEKSHDPFSRPMQEYVAEACWGWVWSRPGLELKTRSFLNIAMLCCQNRGTELATHVKGALTNGATEEEVREVILQATAYCGMPAGIEGFRVAGKAVSEWKEEQHRHGHHVDGHADIGMEMRTQEHDV